MSAILKTGRLGAVYCLGQIAMEKGILDIQLMNRPAARECQGQNCADSSRFDNRTEGLIKINTWALCEATKHPTGLVPFQRTICLELVLEHPFAANNIGLRWSRNQIPSVVHQQCIVLLHGSTPIGVGEAPTV